MKMMGVYTDTSSHNLLKCTQPLISVKNSACNRICNNGRAVNEHFRKQNVPDAAIAEGPARSAITHTQKPVMMEFDEKAVRFSGCQDRGRRACSSDCSTSAPGDQE